MVSSLRVWPSSQSIPKLAHAENPPAPTERAPSEFREGSDRHGPGLTCSAQSTPRAAEEKGSKFEVVPFDEPQPMTSPASSHIARRHTRDIYTPTRQERRHSREDSVGNIPFRRGQIISATMSPFGHNYPSSHPSCPLGCYSDPGALHQNGGQGLKKTHQISVPESPNTTHRDTSSRSGHLAPLPPLSACFPRWTTSGPAGDTASERQKKKQNVEGCVQMSRVVIQSPGNDQDM